MQSLKNKKGYTMVEVLVAFVILLIGISMLFSCLKMATNVQMNAVDEKNRSAEWTKQLNAQLVRNGETESYQAAADGETVNYSFHLIGESYGRFTVKAATGTWTIDGFPYQLPIYGVTE